MPRNKTQVEATTERLIQETTPVRKKRRKRALFTKNSQKETHPAKKVVALKTLEPETYFMFAFEDNHAATDRRKGVVVRHSPMGTTVTIYGHVEGPENYETFIPTQTYVISSETKVRKLL